MEKRRRTEPKPYFVLRRRLVPWRQKESGREASTGREAQQKSGERPWRTYLLKSSRLKHNSSFAVPPRSSLLPSKTANEVHSFGAYRTATAEAARGFWPFS